MGCSPSGRSEWDTTVRLHFHFSLSHFGEGNGNPLQCSCLENPRDGGAWWAAVYGVAQSRTRLKRLSSSSSRIHFGASSRKQRVLRMRRLHEALRPLPGSVPWTLSQFLSTLRAPFLHKRLGRRCTPGGISARTTFTKRNCAWCCALSRGSFFRLLGRRL